MIVSSLSPHESKVTLVIQYTMNYLSANYYIHHPKIICITSHALSLYLHWG